MMTPSALHALEEVIALARRRAAGRIPLIGVAGPQGSGKTTLVRTYASLHPKIACLSLDDVYLDPAARRRMAHTVHPLFATRGPPGTHDLDLMGTCLDALSRAGAGDQTPLPAFDKLSDQPLARCNWPVMEGAPDLILVDGWCLGATPQAPDALLAPVNPLEAERDEAGLWRGAVNRYLAEEYASLFARFDAMLYLRAPDFDIVHSWRCEQEEGLLGRKLRPPERERIGEFILYFERLTRHMMAGGRRAALEAALSPGRDVTEVKQVSG